MSGPYHAQAFGLHWSADLPLDLFEQSDAPAGSPDVVIARSHGVRDRGAGIAQVNGGTIYPDGVRFPRGDVVTFDTVAGDTVAGDTIAWTPGDAWSDAFPQALYSSVAAFVLAWRGAVPLHGTAVAIDGYAVLICGRSGLGKSTLAAGLIAQGGRLISDDLSVLDPLRGPAVPCLLPGRPGLRLHPASAALFPKCATTPSNDGSGKAVVRPPHVGQSASVPLTAIVLLGQDCVPPLQRSATLRAQIFRPRWMAALPGNQARSAVLHRLASQIPMLAMAAAPTHDRAEAAERALRLRDALSRQR